MLTLQWTYGLGWDAIDSGTLILQDFILCVEIAEQDW
jgi:hypothetical protein